MPGGAFHIQPALHAQLIEQSRYTPQPVRVERLRRMGCIQAGRQVGEGQVFVAMGIDSVRQRTAIRQVERLGQLHADMLLQPGDQFVQLGDMLFDPGLHQGRDRGCEQVDRGFLATAEAGAVAAYHGAVIALVEQQGFQRADFFVQIVDAAVLRRRGGQIQPEIPVAAQDFGRSGGLRDHC